MLRRSSPRALSSTRHTLCFPFSAAVISAGTRGVSSLVRYTVDLSAIPLVPVELHQLRNVCKIERAFDRINQLVVDTEPGLDALAHCRRHRARHLEARHLAEPPAPELELDRLEEVVGLVRDLEVGVAGDTE